MSDDSRDNTRGDVDIIEKAAVFKGYFRVDRYRLRHRLHSGGMSGEITREVFERGHAVSVLPYDPVRREIVMLKQFRVGAYAAGREPWLTEIVAGIIDDGETAEQVARRELEEESGLEAMALEHAVTYLASPGGSSETVQIFCARVDTSKAGGIHGLDQEDEDILVMPMPVEEAFALLTDKICDNSQTVIALQWLMLNENSVRAKWGFGPV